MSMHRLAPLATSLFALCAVAQAQINTPPVANTGGNFGNDYRVDCNNVHTLGSSVTSVQLDGSLSYDPDGTPVTFLWHNECKNGYFDDPTSPTPVYHIDMTGTCSQDCWIALRVSSGGQTTIKGFQVFVDDVTPPVLAIPADVLGIWGDSLGLANTGAATVTDNCDPAPTLNYSDMIIPVSGPGQPELTLQRTWTTQDCAGHRVSGIQMIIQLAPTGAPGSNANLDFDPTQCPNIYSMAETGSVDVMVLGSASFKAEQIIPTSVRLSIRQLPGVLVIPSSTQLRDFGSITAVSYGECNNQDLDGRRDLRLRFNRASLASELNLAQFSGQMLEVTVTGYTTLGKLFGTRDYITVQ